MKAMWRLFVGDVRRITSNVVSVIIVIGLVAIPSLFAWFNIAASWDPFDNVKNMKFAVANTDEGYQSDLIPVKISVGDQVVNALRANSQLDWTFTTKSEAIEGTKSGEYYAAIIIPKTFSADMMTFFSDDVEHAQLTYLRNEKKSALSANITGQGADEVANEINTTFAQTMTSTALDIISSLADQLSDPDAQTMLARFNTNISDFATQLTGAADTLDTIGTLVDSADDLLDSSATLLEQTSQAATDTHEQLSDAKQGITSVADALDGSASTVTSSLEASADSLNSVSNSIDALFDDAADNASTAAQALRSQADTVATQAQSYQSILTALQNAGYADSTAAQAITRAIDQLNSLSTALDGAADQVESSASDTAAQREQVQQLITQATDSIGSAKQDFNDSIAPQISQLSTTVSDASSLLADDASQLTQTLEQLDDTASSAESQLADMREILDSTASQLRTAGGKLADFNTNLSQALNSGDMSQVREVLGDDTETLAASLAAPVTLTRKAVYPVENFGSSMTPYYTFIPLWTASILILLSVKTTVSRRRREELGDPSPNQLFLGRFGVFAVISLLQSTVSCAGSLLFLRVQAVHPLLFMLSGWVGGLLFAFIMYTLVVSFGNIGKAIGMLLLVFQVSGSAGSYPIQVLPDFMQVISPFLPITHAIRAMRAAIAGIYQNDFWVEIGILLAFSLPFLLLGLVLRKPLTGLNRWISEQLERTKLIG
ncbi:YhgE/Pip domain-containing protein [Bifidobacterium eulemuris]|uniref:Phage infection protein n=1 Tax=Bifidobacterium eulemuris TaxID=1765219 RepID=A0A261GEH4_9BIFI|nr:YhgE/Pip domain-containing protein [Bifidobacterium eulemuris]OZG69485.1 phage infection protein [Bifidobacterium eulemuris]QOL32156.1 YhgE/Pip domain-containing protein [Bifidobacterium eulemuris]